MLRGSFPCIDYVLVITLLWNLLESLSSKHVSVRVDLDDTIVRMLTESKEGSPSS